jgi:hypothetical protein
MEKVLIREHISYFLYNFYSKYFPLRYASVKISVLHVRSETHGMPHVVCHSFCFDFGQNCYVYTNFSKIGKCGISWKLSYLRTAGVCDVSSPTQPNL